MGMIGNFYFIFCAWGGEGVVVVRGAPLTSIIAGLGSEYAFVKDDGKEGANGSGV